MHRSLFILAASAFVLTACDRDQEMTNAVTDPMAGEPIADRDAAQGADAGVLLSVDVSGVQPGGGTVYATLQDRTNFATAEGLHTGSAEANADEVTVPIPDVPPGEYAVAVFQDTNNDGRIVINSEGVTEPSGFSGPPQAGWPEFDIARIEVGGQGARASVALQTSALEAMNEDGATGDPGPMPENMEGER